MQRAPVFVALAGLAATATADVFITSADRSLRVEASLDIFEQGAGETARLDFYGGAGPWNIGLQAMADPFSTSFPGVYFVHAAVDLRSSIEADAITATASDSIQWQNVGSGLATGYTFALVTMVTHFEVTTPQPFVFEGTTQDPATIFLSGPDTAIDVGFGKAHVSASGVLAPGSYRLEAEYGFGVDFDSTSGSGGTGQLTPVWDVSLRFVPAPGTLALLAMASIVGVRRRTA